MSDLRVKLCEERRLRLRRLLGHAILLRRGGRVLLRRGRGLRIRGIGPVVLHGTRVLLLLLFVDDGGLGRELGRVHDTTGHGGARSELIVGGRRVLTLILAGVGWIEVRHLSEERWRGGGGTRCWRKKEEKGLTGEGCGCGRCSDSGFSSFVGPAQI